MAGREWYSNGGDTGKPSSVISIVSLTSGASNDWLHMAPESAIGVPQKVNNSKSYSHLIHRKFSATINHFGPCFLRPTACVTDSFNNQLAWVPAILTGLFRRVRPFDAQ